MTHSTYDPCLIITKSGAFGVVGIQCNDTLMLNNADYAKQEEKEICFKTKGRTQLTQGNKASFNGTILYHDTDGLITV